ncbi:MAG: acyltransferase family protein, partial [Rhizobiaceae bacterium]
FFMVSGLLVAASFERQPNIVAFAKARFLRIYPGLIGVSLLVFVLCALFVSTSDFATMLKGSIIGYFAVILIELAGSSALPGVFENLPMAGDVNVPLWTLKYEVMSYIALGLVMTFVVKTRLITEMQAALGVVFVSAAFMLFGNSYNEANFFDHAARFSFAFWCGVLAWHLRNRIPVHLGIALAVFLLAAMMTYFRLPFYQHLMIILSGYLAIYIAQFNFGVLTSFTDKNDLSYGVYILGWPAQQMLLFYGIGITPIANTLLAFAVVLPMAFLSWRLIERPALRMKGRFA